MQFGQSGQLGVMQFIDRHDAGMRLAQELLPYRDQHPFIIALPRGGVIVAYEIAKALHAPLDVIVVRKLGVPWQPELGFGAIGPAGMPNQDQVQILNRDMIDLLRIPEREIEQIIHQESREMERRLERYRGNRPMPDLQGKTVILVDDGLATGVSAGAAILAIRQMQPEKIILAVPVSSMEAADALGPQVDDLISLCVPEHFMGVGSWYQDFKQVSDEEVVACLKKCMQTCPQ